MTGAFVILFVAKQVLPDSERSDSIEAQPTRLDETDLRYPVYLVSCHRCPGGVSHAVFEAGLHPAASFADEYHHRQ